MAEVRGGGDLVREGGGIGGVVVGGVEVSQLPRRSGVANLHDMRSVDTGGHST